MGLIVRYRCFWLGIYFGKLYVDDSYGLRKVLRRRRRHAARVVEGVQFGTTAFHHARFLCCGFRCVTFFVLNNKKVFPFSMTRAKR